ncbi:MAG: polysaccharide deacetylase family protein [Clostridium sp.]|uniref:polysaccharide deacetylase family protein n=1 Tax=Clostridium sp. TaxID=1506 RepID=UPI002FC78D02
MTFKFIKRLFLIVFSLILLTIPVTTSFAKISSPEQKIIYLTLDDGPDSIVTGKCLDVLNKYKVKGTFFVVGEQFEGNEDVLKRIVKEGHSVGLHSYTHDFPKLYHGNTVNLSFFMDEMLNCQEELYKLTGVKSNILRFPGGSYKRLSNSVLTELHSRNLKVFDWTHSSEDAVNLNASPYTLYQKSLKKIPSGKKSPGVILLMHCNSSNKASVKALPLIIEHYIKEGYTFKVIDNTTPEYYAE